VVSGLFGWSGWGCRQCVVELMLVLVLVVGRYVGFGVVAVGSGVVVLVVGLVWVLVKGLFRAHWVLCCIGLGMM